MHANRFVQSQSSAARKPRLEGKASLLPKPRRPGSTDRLSTEARRPSTTGHRSSSAEPPRATFGGVARLSREASATKLPINRRSRSQQGEKYSQSSTTPLRSSQYSRSTTTPVRTPSEDRANRNWETSLDRALAFLTIKDQRPISNAAWQRAEFSRVQEALAARRLTGAGGGAALIRPLTIARFVDIVGALLAAITGDAKLNNDNYVTKLQHLCKRFLYPGTVSKSWLKTVNTLHAFPQALALIAYFLDLVNHIEIPVTDDWLYLGKDELACLRRDYVHKCWIRFQEPDPQFEDLNEEYLHLLRALLGNDEEKIGELQHVIEKYEACLEDEAEAAARREEGRLGARREALAGALRGERAARRADLHEAAARRADLADHASALKQLDAEIERASSESQRLKREVETQTMTIAERTRLLDEIDYANRVQDSKRALAEQIAKMVLSKETELALWQKKTLDSCVEYKQGLIHLSAQFPELAALAVDEKELMEAECGSRVSGAVEALRARAAQLAERRAHLARLRTAAARTRAAALDEARAKISETKASMELMQQALEAEARQEAGEAGASALRLRELAARCAQLAERQHHHDATVKDLHFWEVQEERWRLKLEEMRDYIDSQREEAKLKLEEAREKRVRLIVDYVKIWNEKLAQ